VVLCGGALASDRPRVAAARGAAAGRRRSRQLLGHRGDRDCGAGASADQGVGEVLDVDEQVARRGLDRDGPIPIERGSGESGALDRANRGAPQGRMYRDLSRGHTVTRSSGAGPGRRRLPGAAVPEATIVGVACNGTVAIPRFPRARPRVRVEFFEFDRRAIAPEESPQQYSTRLLAQPRQRAPIEVAGRKRAAATRWPRPHLVPGASDHRQARWQGRTPGGARSDR
jgi:hypothetical protein